jgi:hypothetical protein
VRSTHHEAHRYVFFPLSYYLAPLQPKHLPQNPIILSTMPNNLTVAYLHITSQIWVTSSPEVAL